MGARMPRPARRRRRRHRPCGRPADDAVLRRDGRRTSPERHHRDRQERGAGDQAASARRGQGAPPPELGEPAAEGVEGIPRTGMRQTLAQKLVARAAGRSTVTPGEIVTCKVDLAMMHDSSGPRRVQPMLERLGAKVWDPGKVVVITDHYLPAHDDESRNIIRIARQWVREAGIDSFYDAQGICHVVLPERGHLRPGMFVVGGQVGLIASDSVTREFLKPETEIWESDAGAPLLAHHRFNAGELPPQVAAPHSPANTKAVHEFRDVKPDLAYIGACTGAKLEDLRMAARVLRGRKSTVKLLVAPASLRDQQGAEREGTVQVLLDAGAELLANSCGMCAGYGEHLLPENAVAISTTARNFKGRMGSGSAQVYLASPYTVAASAVAGRVCDPREMLA